MRFFDAHTHLNDPHFAGQTVVYLQQAQELGVQEMAIVGSNAQFNQSALELARQYSGLHAVIGWHPEFAAQVTPQVLAELEQELADPAAVAVGEIGLDYHWEENPTPAIQEAAFVQQLELAQQLQLPVNIHTRDAFADTYRILQAHPVATGMIMHSFNGSVEWLNRFLDLGCYVSYSGVVSFKNAPEVREAAQQTPLERLLVETDAPYLTPEPHRGEANQPGYTRYVAAAIARTRGVELATIAQQTLKNTREVYQLNDKD
ncbi:TatD family hydrolase [Lactobacillus sp. DCY120]|uniref:TatD family hydrolase n=1 Tax=Bombilactobacillus apium TaxID=2675299 RepID=A0A850QZY0_9LACO|nr:TatD family hydrolase [Bombilactobacillus apium]NVY96349.1 TatD family hydrolase [Bombilactobacillus apium]